MKGRSEMAHNRILLVDDEEIFARNLSRLLTTREYEVVVAHNGLAALEALGKSEFDIMVLDLKMPGMDGLTTLRELQKLGICIDTLVLTGHGSIDSALEALKLGAYDYLTKPCDIAELMQKLENVREYKRNRVS